MQFVIYKIIIPIYRILKKFVLSIKNIKYLFLIHKIIFSKELSYIIFIDHDGGGGKALYRKNYLNETKGNIICINNKNFIFGVVYEVEFDGHFYYTRHLKFLKDLQIKKIILNSLVSWKNLYKTISYIKCLIELKHPFFQVNFHEYLPICKHFNLINNDFYCKLECDKCSFGSKHKDWISKWNEIIDVADEIRVFSNSSAEIFIKTFPNKKNNIKIIPHNTDYFSSMPVKISDKHMRIGIFGIIGGIPKGLKAVYLFLKYMERYHPDIKVYLFGYYPFLHKNLYKLGKYKTNELGNLLLKYGINCVFFPSVCPETFSYTIEELKKIDIPIVCFNIGAQAEKCKLYEKGSTINEMNPEKIYKELCYLTER